MSQYSELRQVLQAHLNWHGARISFLALFLLALLKVKTVNLSELCLGFGGKALPESSYKRLQRFFREFIGQAWVRYLLLEPALVFRLRIRGSDQIEHDGKVLAAGVVFAHLQVGQFQRLTGNGLQALAGFGAIRLPLKRCGSTRVSYWW